MPTLYFTVTNDLRYDQRMIRICSSLAEAGYDVWLIGRRKRQSPSLTVMPYKQKRLFCFFERGFAFYAEYNIRLFCFLLFRRMDLLCAIDLDTILPVYVASKLKRVKRVYDAHELFCEMKEIATRPRLHRFWKWIERCTVPHFKWGYTVNQPIADEFNQLYGVNYGVIRSIARFQPVNEQVETGQYILYQGAVNEGRSFETLIPAMQYIDIPLWICGDGNFMQQAKALVAQYGVQQKVIFKGMVAPESLPHITAKARIGLTLFEGNARSNYFSLANRFFDYMQAGVPQLCMDYPVYRELNNRHHIAVLVSDLSPESLAREINSLLQDTTRWQQIREHCKKASTELNWENESKKLIAFYKTLVG